MRAWPSNFSGLRLRLSSGWYPLPSYVPAHERERLIELLVGGLADIDAVVELGWDDLDHADQLQLTRSLVVVRVPSHIEPGDDALRSARAKLGSVRFGLLHYEAAGTWPEVAWQEREVKAPLLLWLKRWLRDEAHPLAKLGIAAAPVDELAKLTPEPAELLGLLDAMVEHRLRYRAQGMSAEDWRRSALQVAADRLAMRLKQVPDEVLAAAFDLARIGGDKPLATETEQREAAVALARVGLAWDSGHDVLIGPLARTAGRADVIRQLFDQLPENAWSGEGRRALQEAMVIPLSVPRAVLVAPELPYARWPALRVELGFKHWTRLLFVNCSELPIPLQGFTKVFRDAAREPHGLPVSSDVEAAAIDATLTLLEELDKPELLTLDFERGRLHRFDAIDRAWDFHPRSKAVRAYLRWVVIRWISSFTHESDKLDVLQAEVARALELAEGQPRMVATLQVLAGDLYAQRGRVHHALKAWETAETVAQADTQTPLWDIERHRLELRRRLALLRLDSADDRAPLWPRPVVPEDSGWFQNDVPDELAHDMLAQLQDVAFADRRWLTSALQEPFDDSESRYGLDAILMTTQAAAALEIGDWARAHYLLYHATRASVRTRQTARDLLLWTWVRTSIGQLDLGERFFELLRDQSVKWDDNLLHALALRGLALVALMRNQNSDAFETLAKAIDIERDLDLPDADLLQLELDGLKFLDGQLSSAEFSETLAKLAFPSASFEAQAVHILARVLTDWAAKAQRDPLPQALFDLIAARSGGRPDSPWAKLRTLVEPQPG